jgi:cytochrome c biogenesis protein CcmG/thiol:disulfide interchange protein DsbE
MITAVAVVLVLVAGCKRAEAPVPSPRGAAQNMSSDSAPVPPAGGAARGKTPDDVASRLSMENATPVGSVAATLLTADFDSNRIRASQIYVGKIYEISGPLTSAEDDPAGPYLMLGGVRGDVMCRVARSDLPTVARLLPHSLVTVTGLVTGKTSDQLRCRGCTSSTVYVEPCLVARCRNIERDCLPAIAYVDTQGHSYTAQLAGKVVVVSFCATWARPCQTWLPELARVYDKYEADGIVVLSVITDNLDEPALRQFQVDHQISPAVVRGTHDIVAAFNYPDVVPTIFVFDQTGKLVFRHSGPPQEEKLLSLLHTLVVR